MKIDPNKSIKGQLFGLPIGIEKAGIIFIPAPWSVTSSTHAGTVLGPENILSNSYSVGLYREKYPDAWQVGMAMLPMPHGWKIKSDQLRDNVRTYIQSFESGSNIVNTQLTSRVDQYTIAFKERIKSKALMYMKSGKMVGLVGGEQSCALGLIEACAKLHPQFGLLHIDAHADLRQEYQGFRYSHASTMHHTLKIKEVDVLVQVGLRDYCEEEAKVMEEAKERIFSFTDHHLRRAIFEGGTWGGLCDKIVAKLPDKVYISFDIDGLDPKLCPSTSRPVPGGLQLAEAVYLIEKIVAAGKQIIAFDLSEVAFNGETEWDGLVGSYLLYELGILMAASQRRS